MNLTNLANLDPGWTWNWPLFKQTNRQRKADWRATWKVHTTGQTPHKPLETKLASDARELPWAKLIRRKVQSFRRERSLVDKFSFLPETSAILADAKLLLSLVRLKGLIVQREIERRTRVCNV